MEILLGVLLSFLMEIQKWLSRKFGAKHTKNGIYLFLFIVSIAWTLLNRAGYITQEMILYWWGIISTSVTTYELFIKHVVNYLGKTKNK